LKWRAGDRLNWKPGPHFHLLDITLSFLRMARLSAMLEIWIRSATARRFGQASARPS